MVEKRPTNIIDFASRKEGIAASKMNTDLSLNKPEKRRLDDSRSSETSLVSVIIPSMDDLHNLKDNFKR